MAQSLYYIRYFIFIVTVSQGFVHGQITTSDFIFNKNIISDADGSSCKHKCGKAQVFPCSCDVRCVVYDNCCLDMEELCPDIVARGRRLYRQHVEADSVCRDKFFMIDNCPNTSVSVVEKKHQALAVFTERGLEEFDKLGTSEQQRDFWRLLSEAPVTQLSTGINFRNFSVYSCFSRNLSDFQMFDMTVVSTQFVSLTTFDRFVDSLSLGVNKVKYVVPSEPISDIVIHNKCKPIFQNRDICKSAVDISESNYTEMSIIRDKCISKQFSFVHVGPKIFKNRYCALCNGKEASKIKTRTQTVQYTSKSVFSISVKKRSLILRYEYGSAPAVNDYNDAIEPFGSWKKSRCEFPVGGDEKLPCKTLMCSRYHVIRPSGVCATIYGIGIGIFEDSLSHKQVEYINFLINCHLNHLDVTQSYGLTPFVFKPPKTKKRVFIFQLNVYSDLLLSMRGSDPASVLLVSKIAQIAKSFRMYRMKNPRNNTINLSDEDESRYNNRNAFIHVTGAFRHEIQSVAYIVSRLNRNKTATVAEMGIVKACVCSNLLVGEVLNCRLICFQDQVFLEDLHLLDSSNVCRDRVSKSKAAKAEHLHLRLYVVATSVSTFLVLLY